MIRRKLIERAIVDFNGNAEAAGVDRVFLDDAMVSEQLARYIDHHLEPEDEPESKPEPTTKPSQIRLTIEIGDR